MADDLTQAPSPSEGTSRALPPAPAPEQATAPRREEGVHVRQFRLVYAVLALLVGAAVGGFIVLWGHSGSSGPAWSAWKPSGGQSDEMKDIARFVGSRYRLDDGSKLVRVGVSSPPSFQRVPLPVRLRDCIEGEGSAEKAGPEAR